VDGDAGDMMQVPVERGARRRMASLWIVGLLVLGSFLGILVISSQKAEALTWVIQSVDADGQDVGDGADHALDSMGRPHISYHYIDYLGHPNQYGIRHAWWDGAMWNVEIVDPDVGYGIETSIAIDSLDRAHISYYTEAGNDLRYASWTGSIWNLETVDSVGDVGDCSSLILDSLDRPHIAYHDWTNHFLKYAWWDGAQWKIETVDSAAPYDCATDLALDSLGRPHIAYTGSNGTDIKHTWWTGSVWNNETIDSGEPDCSISLALDSLDRPRVSYILNHALKYAAWNGIMWDIQTLDSPNQEYAGVSLVLDGADAPHITFDRWSGNLEYAYWTGSAWSIETVDTGLNVGRASSLVLTASGDISVAYHDDIIDFLKYARTSSGTPPEASFTATPIAGDITTTFQVDASASSDLEDPPTALAVRWDWENNGIWDTTWTTSKTASHQYPTLGGRWIRLQVRDTEGMTDMAARLVWVNNTSPAASFTVTPAEGNVATSFAFDASGSSDLEDPPTALEVRWDWENDAAYDTPWSVTKTAAHTFGSPGTFTIRLSVRDTSGYTNWTTRQVLVQQQPDYVPANPYPFTRTTMGLSLVIALTLDVRNDGGSANQTAVIAFYNESTPFSPYCTFQVPAVTVGDISGPFTTMWMSPATPGTYRVTANVDYHDDIAELNESNNVYIWTIDVVAGPNTILVIGQPNYSAALTYVTSSTPLLLEAIGQEGAGIAYTEYRVDDGNWADHVIPFSLSGSGVHAVEYRSADIYGNIEATRSALLVVDDTPPASTFHVGMPSFVSGGTWITSSTDLAITAVESAAANATFTMRWQNLTVYNEPINGGEPFPDYLARANLTVAREIWPGLASVTFLLSGRGCFDVDLGVFLDADGDGSRQASELVGYGGGPTSEESVVLNRPAPGSYIIAIAGYDVPPSGCFIDIEVVQDFGGSASSGLSNITNRVFSLGSWTIPHQYSGPFRIHGDGVAYVEYYSVDNVTNAETTLNATLHVDDTPPVTTISPAAPFTLAATDSGCGVNVTMYRIDGGNWTVYTGGFTLPEGEHTIYYYSIDNLSNAEQERSLVVRPTIEVAANYKPIVALIFMVILAVAGIWSSKRRPWKGGKDKMAVTKAFVISSLPFVLAETVTGVISLATGQLSIPPLLGAGTAVDLAILIVGVAVAFYRTTKAAPQSDGSDEDSQHR
jgi:hypothetical protein